MWQALMIDPSENPPVGSVCQACLATILDRLPVHRMANAGANEISMLINQRIEHDGIFLFAGIKNQRDFQEMFKMIAERQPHPDDDDSGFTRIYPEARLVSGTLGVRTNQTLGAHTDGSAVVQPPLLVATYLAQPAIRGGDALLLDGHRLVRRFRSANPRAFAILCESDVLMFGREKLPAPVFSADGGYIKLRCRSDGLLTPRDQHANAAYLALQTMIDDDAVRVPLIAGSGYIAQNNRWLHGRTRFTGHRLMYRGLGNPLDQRVYARIASGFEPCSRMVEVDN